MPFSFQFINSSVKTSMMKLISNQIKYIKRVSFPIGEFILASQCLGAVTVGTVGILLRYGEELQAGQ